MASFAPYWLPLIAILLAYEVVRWVRVRCALLFGAGMLVVLAATLIRGVVLLLPEWGDSQSRGNASPATLRIMFGEHSAIPQEEEAIDKAVRSLNVDLIVTSGKGHPASRLRPLDTSYPYRLKTGLEGQPTFEVASRLPWDAQSIIDLGDYALPAALLRVPFGNGQSCWIGIFSLYPTTSQAQFERNKVTVRRMASFVKNLSEPVVLLADLQSSTFSRFYTMFTEQIKLVGLFEGRGLFFKTTSGRSVFTPLLQHHILVGGKVEIVAAKILDHGTPATLLLEATGRISPQTYAK